MSENAFRRLMSRMKNLIDVSTITGAETGIVQIKMSTGKANDRIKRLHNYGFMSRPLVGARSYTLFLGGTVSRGFSICAEDERHQMELEPGEVAMLDDKGNLIHFTKNGIKVKSLNKIEVEAAKDITVTSSSNVIVKGKNIKMNDGSSVVTTAHICSFTGCAHTDGSSTVTAGK
ncbi:phage baseplate assembly protein domain-containing protein [Vibrio sp. OPT18]|uniref:phage baseplate assembly protein domain-containing protein n=1 Tax=Vibrio sp. OPT18 TaxID=2778641 RepID=UPI001882E371|nr:phage baseplate assembly protein [Vibrio sp. OPT18]MBE8578672.1 phage baseplate assembly protein [Vibrio sp. OPT18]